MSTTTTDNRSVKVLLAQWRKMEEIRRNLTKSGKLSADATPADIIAALRQELPPDVFG